MRDRKLSNREIELLIRLLRNGAAHTPVTLPVRDRRAAVPLWRLSILYIWTRQSLTLRRPEGLFYSLTRDGAYRAEALLNARAARGLMEVGNASS